MVEPIKEENKHYNGQAVPLRSYDNHSFGQYPEEEEKNYDQARSRPQGMERSNNNVLNEVSTHLMLEPFSSTILVFHVARPSGWSRSSHERGQENTSPHEVD